MEVFIITYAGMNDTKNDMEQELDDKILKYIFKPVGSILSKMRFSSINR